MSSLVQQMLFLVHQFLREENLLNSVHRLEMESGLYFSRTYFDMLIIAGQFKEAEDYISAFTGPHQNPFSRKIFFEIRKQKYLEALDKQDKHKALDILLNELQVFACYNQDLVNELALLICMDDFRKHKELSGYTDAVSARNKIIDDLKGVIDSNPDLIDKLAFPDLGPSRLRYLLNQSLNWQHFQCRNPQPSPEMKTLFFDHRCLPSSGVQTPPPANSNSINPNRIVYPQAAAQNVLDNVMGANPPNRTQNSSPGFLSKRVRTPLVNAGANYQLADTEVAMKRSRTDAANEKITCTGEIGRSIFHNLDDLTTIVANSFVQGSLVSAMNFHPEQQNILLVGTTVGDIAIWDVGTGEKIGQEEFKLWDVTKCSPHFQAAFAKDPTLSVNRCVWSLNGDLTGVAFSKHIMHIYQYLGGDMIMPAMEVDAHVGNVNDVAFAYNIYGQSVTAITCGDDKLVKVWDPLSGQILHIFEGHDAPVYSILPHEKEDVKLIFTTSVHGHIKVWRDDSTEPKVNYSAPGCSPTKIAYSSDGKRLFSCGTSSEGQSFLVEWIETDGTIKRRYKGLKSNAPGHVLFDTTHNKFIAAGDEHQIKFWLMDNSNMLFSTNANGSLLARPCLCFNKDGSLLAATTEDSGFVILANVVGKNFLDRQKNRLPRANRVSHGMVNSITPTNQAELIAEVSDRPLSSGTALPMNKLDNRETTVVNTSLIFEDDNTDKAESLLLSEALDSSKCKSIRLTDHFKLGKVLRLLYANSGSTLVSLDENGLNKIWRWKKSEENPSGMATASVHPQMYQPRKENILRKDSSQGESKPYACLAMSKTNYALSASGCSMMLFNVANCQTLVTFLKPPPVPTCCIYHCMDNNIVIIGMDDSSIFVYNVVKDKLIAKLEGHQREITGLAFSEKLSILVSAGADSKLCVWSVNWWKHLNTTVVHLPVGTSPSSSVDIRVQFRTNGIDLLVVQESQISTYDGSTLNLLHQWPKQPVTTQISSASFSCDGELIYVAFNDATIGIFDANKLEQKCHITALAYLKDTASVDCHAPVLAAHPRIPSQFAVGMSDGGVYICEHTDLEAKWLSCKSEKAAGTSDTLQ